MLSAQRLLLTGCSKKNEKTAHMFFMILSDRGTFGKEQQADSTFFLSLISFFFRSCFFGTVNAVRIDEMIML